MTLAKSSALKPVNEALSGRRMALLGEQRVGSQDKQVIDQAQLPTRGEEVDASSVAAQAQRLGDSVGLLERSVVVSEQSGDTQAWSSERTNQGDSATQTASNILTWQASNAGSLVDFAGRLDSFTSLAQASANVLSDLPAKQAESAVASAQGLSFPIAGLVAVGAVIAGVAGGSSGSSSSTSSAGSGTSTGGTSTGGTTTGGTTTGGTTTGGTTNGGTDGTGAGATGAAPTLVIASDKAALKAGDTAQVTFKFSAAVSGFAADDVSVAGGSLSNFKGSGADYSATFTPTAGNAGGNASISVAAGSYTNLAGNPGGAGATPVIAIDTLAPTVAIKSDKTALKAGETANVTFTFSEDPGSSFAWNGSAGDVVVSGGSLGQISGSGLTRTATFTPAVNSTSNASLSVASNTFTDAVGNANVDGSEADNTLTLSVNTVPAGPVDAVPPTLTITSDKASLKAGEAAQVTFKFSEAVVGFVSDDVSVSGGALSNFKGSGADYSASFTPTAGNAGGKASISVAAGSYADIAGNLGGPGATPVVALDTLAPTVAITTDKAALKAGETALVTFKFSESVAGFVSDDVSVSGGTLSNFKGSAADYSATFTPATGGTGGDASIKVAEGSYTDVAGNSGGSGSTAITLGGAPSVAATSTIALDALSDTGASSEDGITSVKRPMLFGAVEGMSEGTTVAVTIGKSSGTPEDLAADGTWTYTPTEDLADGSYKATVVVKTASGSSSTSTSSSIVIDTAAPVLAHQADIVKVVGSKFSVTPGYSAPGAGIDRIFEDSGGYVSSISPDGKVIFDSATGVVSADKDWAINEFPPSFGWVRATATDLAGNTAVDEFQVAAVTGTVNFTGSKTIDESDAFAPTLYVGDAGKSTLTLLATVGSVIQVGDGDDTVILGGSSADNLVDFTSVLNFAAIDGGKGYDALSLNKASTDGLIVDLGQFNRSTSDYGDGTGQILTHFEQFNFSTDKNNTSGTLSLSPADLYRMASDLRDGTAMTFVVTGKETDTVTLVGLDFNPLDDAVDQAFAQVGKDGGFTNTGAAGLGFSKYTATVVDNGVASVVELLIQSAVSVTTDLRYPDPAYPVLG